MFIKSFLFLNCLLFQFYKINGQDWKRVYLNKKTDTLNSVFEWVANNSYHYAFGRLHLNSNYTFSYVSRRSLNFRDTSDGYYTIIKDTLVLNSFLQAKNIHVNIKYVDSISNDSIYKRFALPVNVNGDYMPNAMYYLNEDTSMHNAIWPGFPVSDSYFNNIGPLKRLRVFFGDRAFGSDWVLIQENGKLISIVLQTQHNLYKYRPKVITNYKFLITRNGLKDISTRDL